MPVITAPMADRHSMILSKELVISVLSSNSSIPNHAAADECQDEWVHVLLHYLDIWVWVPGGFLRHCLAWRHDNLAGLSIGVSTSLNHCMPMIVFPVRCISANDPPQNKEAAQWCHPKDLEVNLVGKGPVYYGIPAYSQTDWCCARELVQPEGFLWSRHPSIQAAVKLGDGEVGADDHFHDEIS